MVNHFPPPYPGELLYSTLCRYHAQSGNYSTQKSLAELFRKSDAGNLFILPTNLNNLHSTIPGKPLYNIEKMIYNHTLFPYYACFLNELRRNALENQMRGSIVANIHFKERQIHKLKLCPDCVDKDYIQIGEPFWHVEHQVPFVIWCPSHGCKLIDQCPNCKMNFNAKVNKFFRCNRICDKCGYDFVNLSKLEEIDVKTIGGMSVGRDIKYILENWEYIKTAIPSSWSVMYRKRLQELNFGDTYQAIPWDALEQELSLLCGKEYYDFVSREKKQKWMKDLYWFETPNKTEPLKNILFIKILYGSFYEFVEKNLVQQIGSDKIA